MGPALIVRASILIPFKLLLGSIACLNTIRSRLRTTPAPDFRLSFEDNKSE